jgi:phosphate transport system protein
MKIHIEEKVDFTGIEEYLLLIHEAAVSALEYATRLDDDTEKYEEDYKKTMIQEAKTDDLYSVLEKEILSKMCRQGAELTLNYISILDIARKFERVADHAANIAKMYLYAKKGGSIEVY